MWLASSLSKYRIDGTAGLTQGLQTLSFNIRLLNLLWLF